jgi:hypothetical protein
MKDLAVGPFFPSYFFGGRIFDLLVASPGNWEVLQIAS